MPQAHHVPAAVLIAAIALAGCASGTGSAFSSAATRQAQAADPNDPTQGAPPEHPPGTPASPPGGGASGSHDGGGGGGGGANSGAGAGGGRIIYVSGNVLLPVRGSGLTRGLGAPKSLGAAKSLGVSVGAGKSGAKVAVGGVKVAVNDPLGKVGATAQDAAGALAAPVVGIGKGKPVLGRKGAGGALSGVGKTAGSLIGSGGSQDAGSGGNLLTGLLAGGKHKKPGG